MIINHVTLSMLIDNARSHVALLHEYGDGDDNIRNTADMLHGDLDAMAELVARSSMNDTPVVWEAVKYGI